MQSPSDGPDIVDNSCEIYAAAVLARDLGCDYFEVKPSYEFRGDVAHALVKHDQFARERARAQIERLDELETESFRIYKAINLDASLRGVDQTQTKDYDTCPAAMLRTLITPTGSYVCPYWRGKDAFKIGDVSSQSFKSMWTGLKRRDVMTGLKPSTDCNFHCLRHRSNESVMEIKDSLSVDGNISIVENYDPFI